MFKKLFILLGIILIPMYSIAGPNMLMGIDKGEFEKFGCIWVSSALAVLIIDTNSPAGYTDLLVVNYSTNTYDAWLSTGTGMSDATFSQDTFKVGTSTNNRTGNIYPLEPTESVSPAGIFSKNVPIYIKMAPGAPVSRIKFIPMKYKTGY